ncbi:Cell wall binding repeat protein, partial [human gut metagenome]
ASCVVTNETDTDQLLIDINKAITNPGIFVSYSSEPLTKVNSTENADGHIKGSLMLADSDNHKVKIPVNLTISKLNMTIDTAVSNIQAYLSTLNTNNTLSADEILNGIKDLIDSKFNININDYVIKEATELEKGQITGNIVINDLNNTREIPINLEIDLQAQSIDNVRNLINEKLKDMYLKNTSTSKELEEELNKCLTGAEGSK